jgi:hypothetical protein
MHLLRLTTEGSGTLYYAPWRDDPRPLGGLLQGVYAFLGIASFWRRRHQSVSGADAALAAFEYGHARGQTNEALRLVRSAGELTDDGCKFVDGLLARAAPWLSEPLPPEIDRLVRLTLDSHRTTWRLRHLHPEPGEVLGLAKAWLAGNPPDAHLTRPTLVPHPELRWPQRIAILARRRVGAIGRGDRDGAASVTDASSTALAVADAALVAGEASAARDGYLAVILDSSRDLDSRDEVDAWTGLALAVAHAGPRPAVSALLTRPELVRAVHAEIAATGAAPDPVDLAGWLAGASPSP